MMRLRRAMLNSTAQQNATLLLFFATGIVIAHLLTPRQAGSYSIALAAAGTVADLKDSALGSYVVSSPKFDDTLLRTAFGLSLTIAVCLTIGLFALSFMLATFYGDPALGHSLRILAFAQLGPAIAFPATMRLMRAMRFGALLAIGLAAAGCQSAVSIILATCGYGAEALAWGYLASTVITAAMTVAYMPDAVRLRPTLAGSRHLLTFGGWTSATHLIGSTALSAPSLMIGRGLGIASAALFSRAQTLISFVRNGLVLGMTRPLLPSLGARESADGDLASVYEPFVETMTGLAWPVYVLLAIWAEPMVTTLYGQAWSAAGPMMIPIALAHAVMLTIGPYYDILVVKRRQRTLFICEAVGSVLTILMLAAGLPFGIGGAIWTLPLSSVLVAACYFVVLRSAIAFDPRRLFKAWGRSLALALAVAPAPLACRYLLPSGPTATLLGFMASGVVSAAIWTVTLMLIRHELSGHVHGLIRDILRWSGAAAPPHLLGNIRRWLAIIAHRSGAPKLWAGTQGIAATLSGRDRQFRQHPGDAPAHSASGLRAGPKARAADEGPRTTPALDGLRAISIALVLAAHLLPLGPKSLQLNSTAGPMGMSLFFALSGYLIVRTLRTATLFEFIIKRLARILPLAYLYIALVLVVFGLSRQALLYHLGFTINYHLDRMIPVTEHLWSLCVEVHFYLLVVVLAATAGRKGLMLVWPLCAAVTAIRIMQGVHIDVATHLRIDEILAGACVATLPLGQFRSSRLSLLVWAVAAGVWAGSSHPDSGWLQYLRPYATGLLLWATISQPPNLLITVLGSRPLAYIAATSYALYVIHPLTAHGWWNDGSIYQRYLLKRPLGFALTVLAAHLSTFYWERMWLQSARRWLKSRYALKPSIAPS